LLRGKLDHFFYFVKQLERSSLLSYRIPAGNFDEFDFQPNSEKCVRFFSAFSDILRTEERMFEIGKADKHVQEHAAQLNMFLGQNAIDVSSDWVSRVKADEGGTYERTN